MKKEFFYLCAVICTFGLMTSCRHEVTPETMSGIYHGKMDMKFNIPNLHQDELELPGQQATVTKVNDSYVDIALNLDLKEYVDESLATLIGENLDFGNIIARCLVGPTIDGEASLSGTATVGDKSVPVYGEYDEQTLDVTVALEVISVEFEGVKR